MLWPIKKKYLLLKMEVDKIYRKLVSIITPEIWLVGLELNGSIRGGFRGGSAETPLSYKISFSWDILEKFDKI